MTAQRICPDFLSEFACKCGACRRTCCRDWEVRLSKPEFLACNSAELGPEALTLAQANLNLNPDGQGDGEYALCALHADGFCSFLTTEGLCAWKKLRNEGLCQTCDNFPNTFISFLEEEFVFPSISCEAIAELLIHRSSPIRLARASISSQTTRPNIRIEQQNFPRRPLLAFYPQLIEWGMTLLQDRRFPLDDRMVLLAHAMCLIDWMERNGRVAELPAAMLKFLQLENLQQALHQYDQFTIGPKALLTVNGRILLRLIDLPPYQATVRLVLDGLGIEIVESEEDGQLHRHLKLADSQKYARRKEALAGFLRQKETFLEHVLVCEYLRAMVPVAAPSVWDNFKFFNVSYALLKGILMGSFDAAPTDRQTVDAVSMLHRMFVHDYEACGHTLEHLDAIQLTDLTSMVALAKG